MKPLLPPAGSVRRAVAVSFTVIGVTLFAVGGIAFVGAAGEGGAGLSPLQMVIAVLLLVVVASLWLTHGSLIRHFDALERLRAGVLVASANNDCGLPPTRASSRQGSAEEALRLRTAVETLIARRLFPNATIDERLHAVLASLDEGILVVTVHGQISLVNGAAKALLGGERVAIGASLFASLDREMLVGAMNKVEHALGPVTSTLCDVEGNSYAAKLSPLKGHSGVVVRLSLESLRHPTVVRPQPVPRGEMFQGAPKGRWADGEHGNVICLTAHRSPAAVAAPEPEHPRHGGPIEHDFSLHDEVPNAVMAPDTPLDDLPVLVFDAESTGLNTKTDRVVQVGGVRVHGGRIFPVAIIDRLVNPAMPIPSASTAVHGITDQMVTNAPPFAAVWPSLEPLMRGAVIVGHNIGFDLAMLERECALLDQPFVPPPTLDTLLLAGLLLPDIGELNLDNVAATLGVDIHGRHTALGDALVTAEIYVRMIPLLQANGIETYAQAYAYTRRATHLLARQRAMGW
jgi:DNA polymerase-3 subunit epsilon